MFYDMAYEIRCEEKDEDIYTLCGMGHDGKILCSVTYYTEEATKENKEIVLDFGIEGEFEIYLLDENHSGELIKTGKDLMFNMKPNSAILIKQI